MKHSRNLFVVATVTGAILIATTLPAMAATPADSLVFFPVPNGPGGTYSCSSGPPFTSELDSAEANCTNYQTGAPAGPVCDIPTTVTFLPTVPEVPDVAQYVAGGMLCH